MRVCGEGKPASGSCSEMQPTQRALHFGETGSAASPRSRKTFCAVKQPYSREQSATCASTRLPGSRRTRAPGCPPTRRSRTCAAANPRLSSVRIAATCNSSSTTQRTCSRRAAAPAHLLPARRPGTSSRVYPAGSITAKRVPAAHRARRSFSGAGREGSSARLRAARDQFVGMHFADDAAVGQRRPRFIEVDASGASQ